MKPGPLTGCQALAWSRAILRAHGAQRAREFLRREQMRQRALYGIDDSGSILAGVFARAARADAAGLLTVDKTPSPLFRTRPPYRREKSERYPWDL